MRRYYTIKEPDVRLEELQTVHPALGVVFQYVLLYADLHNLPVHITSIRERVPGRTSRTHSEGRAIDFSTRLWPKEHLRILKDRINLVYKNWATGPVDGIKRVFVYGDPKHLDHVHLQVRRNIKLD